MSHGIPGDETCRWTVHEVGQKRKGMRRWKLPTSFSSGMYIIRRFEIKIGENDEFPSGTEIMDTKLHIRHCKSLFIC